MQLAAVALNVSVVATYFEICNLGPIIIKSITIIYKRGEYKQINRTEDAKYATHCTMDEYAYVVHAGDDLTVQEKLGLLTTK